jgi:hypothetical protein
MKVKVMSYIVSYDSATDYERVARRKATRALIEKMGYTPIEGTEIEVDDSVLVNEQTPMDSTVPMRAFQVRLCPRLVLICTGVKLRSLARGKSRPV